jgi:hypothetical protein
VGESGRVEWVRQEDANGCALAVIAMIAGHSYAAVKAVVDSWSDEPHDWDKSGTSHYTLDRYLGGLGWFYQRRYAAWNRDGWVPEPFAPIHYASVKQPSDYGHFVAVLYDGTVLDPLREGHFRLSDWQAVNQICGLHYMGAEVAA